MNDSPQIRTLPLSVKEYPDENWVFIKKEVAHELVEQGYSDEILFYEGARQLFAGNYQNERAFQFLVSITDGYFPNYPFLLLSDSNKSTFLKSVRDPRNSIHIGQRFFSQPIAVKGQIQYALLPELENDLEQVAGETAREMSEKHEGTTPEDFLPPWTQAEAAVTRARNQLIAQGDERIDHSLCSFSVNVDFEYSDKEIVSEFEKLIKKERERCHQEVKHERRGKKKTKDQMLRDLAIFSLFKEEENLKSVESFLEINAPQVDLFKSEKGWNGAISSAEKELEHLRFCLGNSDQGKT